MAAWYHFADLFLSRLDAEAAHGLAVARAEDSACCRPTGGPIRRRSPSRCGAAPCPTRSASPRASTRTPKFPTPCSISASAWSRSAASRRGRRTAIPAPACSASPRIAASSTAWASPARASTPRARGSPRARVAASSASMSAPTRTAPTAPPTMLSAARRWRPTPTISSAMSPRPTRRACATCRAVPQLADLLKRVQDAIAAKPVPLLVKIAPDATDDDLDDIVAVCRELQDGRHHRRQHDAVAPRLRCARRGARKPAVCRARR